MQFAAILRQIDQMQSFVYVSSEKTKTLV